LEEGSGPRWERREATCWEKRGASNLTPHLARVVGEMSKGGNKEWEIVESLCRMGKNDVPRIVRKDVMVIGSDLKNVVEWKGEVTRGGDRRSYRGGREGGGILGRLRVAVHPMGTVCGRWIGVPDKNVGYWGFKGERNGKKDKGTKFHVRTKKGND